MMEEAGTPTFLGMTGAEWHAVTYGLKEGFKFWKRSHTKDSDIDKMDIPAELKAELHAKYHYVTFCEDLPEMILLIVGIVYMFVTGQAEGLVKVAINMALSQVGMSV
jgi:hypothetical protein